MAAKDIHPIERVIRPIVEGQIRGFLKEHPGTVEAVDWYKPRTDDKATTFINSLAKRIVRDLACTSSRARLAAALLELRSETRPQSSVELMAAATSGPLGMIAERADATYPERILCAGFDRPECQPCWLVDDIQDTTYDSFGEEVTAPLCTQCRARILTGSPQAWTAA